MRISIRGAVALLGLLGLAHAARAELVCMDGATGTPQRARAGCAAAAKVRPAAPAANPAPAPAPAPAAPSAHAARVGAGPGATPAMPPHPPMVSHWEIRASDLSIYGALKRWSEINGWQLSWELSNDFPVTIVASFDDNFRGAIDTVLQAYVESDVAPKGCFYDNKVVRVVRRVGDGKECERTDGK